MSFVFMNINGEVDIIRQLVSFTRFYDGLSLPLHPDSKATVDAFFGKGGAFVLLCDKIFGKFVDVFYDDDAEMCWMDLANVAPHSPLAKALFRCVSPGTAFVNFLEAISTPSPTFASKVRSGWKDSPPSSSPPAAAKSEEEITPAYTIDFPLSSLLQNSFRLLAESADADLYTFTRGKIPGVLLVPFWRPPLRTRKEQSTQQVMTSLPCSPLCYFILRLVMYVIRRSEKDGALVLSRRQYRGVRSWIRYCEDSVAWLFNRLPPTDFPFFSDILMAYVQTYVTPSLAKTLSSKISVEDVQWTTSDVAATLLICSCSLLSHRHVTQPLLENNRAPVYEPSQLAPVTTMIPFLTEMHIAVHRGIDVARETSSASAVPAGFADDGTFKAGDGIVFITQTLYRNALIVLRETVMSLDGFPRCRHMHFNNALELWLTLMNPLWRVNAQVGLNYISRHYEAYSFITVGFLDLAVKSTMIASLDRGGVDLLVKCLAQLHDPQLVRLADAVHAENGAGDAGAILSSVKRNRVLNWGEDAGTFSLMDLRHNDIYDKAAQLFVLIEQQCESEEYDSRTDGYRQCLAAIASAFPGAKDFLEKWRQRKKLLGGVSHEPANPRRWSSIDTATLQLPQCVTEEEKQKFFKGIKRSCARYSEKVRIATNNGRVHGGDHPSLRTTMHLEFPFLIGPTRILDASIERLVDMYCNKWIPRCEVGHSMVLVNSDRYVCSAHSANVGLWECAICEVVYGSCCRPLPMMGGSVPLSMKRNSDPSAICRRCGELIDKGSICFASPQHSSRVYCPHCASRPFKPWPTRFLAAYSTWAIVVVLFFFVYYVTPIIFWESDEG